MTKHRSELVNDRMAIVEGHYKGLFTIQEKSPISEKTESVTINEEDFKRIANFLGYDVTKR